jgi:2-amino-4-hydroxy-6-hydroxymethyldihydropteridine diphosphokinase
MMATQAENDNGNAKNSHRAYIALGSNIGDRIAMIERACYEMNRAGIKVKRTSSLFETAPMYVLDQEPFLNAACEVRFTFRILPTALVKTSVNSLLEGRNDSWPHRVIGCSASY